MTSFWDTGVWSLANCGIFFTWVRGLYLHQTLVPRSAQGFKVQHWKFEVNPLWLKEDMAASCATGGVFTGEFGGDGDQLIACCQVLRASLILRAFLSQVVVESVFHYAENRDDVPISVLFAAGFSAVQKDIGNKWDGSFGCRRTWWQQWWW